MRIDSKTKESRARAFIFLIAATVMSIALAWGLMNAREGDMVTTFLSIFLGWNGYLLAHYAETGRLVDPKQEETTLPLQPGEAAMTVIGVLMLLGGISVVAVGVAERAFFITSIGTAVFTAGYLVAHHAMTDLLL